MNLLDALIAGKLGRSGGATPAAVAGAIGQFTDAQAAAARGKICGSLAAFLNSDVPKTALATAAFAAAIFRPGNVQIGDYVLGKNLYLGVITAESGGYYTVEGTGEKLPGVEMQTVSGTTATVAAAADTAYECGELTSLTISSIPATGAWSVVFTSGSTATTTTIPSTILGLENFAAEANTLYEINVLDNRAVVGSWAVSSS